MTRGLSIMNFVRIGTQMFVFWEHLKSDILDGSKTMIIDYAPNTDERGE